VIDLVDIKPRFYGKFDCYQNNIVGPVSEYWNVNYLPIFWTEFNFISESNHPDTFEDISFSVGNRFDRGKIWYDFCGVSLNLCKFNDIRIFKKTIIEELDKKNPIVVTIDSNYVPWNKYYQIRPHCFLICDIDEDNNELLCCDGTFHVEDICRIDIQYLFDKYYKLILLSQDKVVERDLENSLIYFLDVFQDNNPHKSDNLNQIADYILHCWNIDNISTISLNISKSYFLLYVTEVCNSRHNFIRGLEYFNHKYKTDLFSSIILELIDVRSSWDAFKGLYVKSILSGKKHHIENTINLLRSINIKEEKISQKILSCCKDKIEDMKSV